MSGTTTVGVIPEANGIRVVGFADADVHVSWYTLQGELVGADQTSVPASSSVRLPAPAQAIGLLIVTVTYPGGTVTLPVWRVE